jgi:integrase/recombinase XerD
MSALSQHVDDYLRLRRALGHKLADAGRLLPRFVASLDDAGIRTVTVQAALTWAQEPAADPQSSVWAHRMSVVRGFARYLAGIDSATEVPPVGLLTHPKRRRCAHLYSEAETVALMDAAHRRIPSPLRAATFETLIGLLAATGMRVGEAIALDRGDVNWAEGLLTVRQTKFMKSRELALHPSTLNALAAYAKQRDALQPVSTGPSFFVSLTGTRLLYENVGRTFRKLVAATGVGAGSVARPCLHGFRHSFVVHSVVDWNRDGEDVRVRMQWLSTYLGHREPRNTYLYLSATPELLTLAAGRLEAYQDIRP